MSENAGNVKKFHSCGNVSVLLIVFFKHVGKAPVDLELFLYQCWK